LTISDDSLLLGKQTDYPAHYAPELLCPIPRADNRAKLNISADLPFHGEDLWTAYELSWLEPSGKPRIALADFHFPSTSPYMIESKSFKLYLNSFNQHVLANPAALRETLKQDLSRAAGAPVRVELRDASARAGFSSAPASAWVNPVWLDELPGSEFSYQPDAQLLRLDGRSHAPVEETLISDLLRSNCPVTGQPDWASVFIRYRGPRIDATSMLRYIVSFRQCQDFHEHCVERIFTDVLARCACESLSVYARYTRRGGLDINPYRATADLSSKAPGLRLVRQ
jgi:7-cyano-7-deazaguanine reductase